MYLKDPLAAIHFLVRLLNGISCVIFECEITTGYISFTIHYAVEIGVLIYWRI